MARSSKKSTKKAAEEPSDAAKLALLSLNQHILQKALAGESDPARRAYYEIEASRVDREIKTVKRSALDTSARAVGERDAPPRSYSYKRKAEQRRGRTAQVVCRDRKAFWTTQAQFWQWVRDGVVVKTGDKPLTGAFVHEAEVVRPGAAGPLAIKTLSRYEEMKASKAKGRGNR